MKTKYVFHGLIYSHVNSHDNRTMRTVILVTKNCRWGEKEKEPYDYTWKTNLVRVPGSRLFFLPPPPTSHKHQFYGVTRGFTKVNYGDQKCLSWPNQFACQFLKHSHKVNKTSLVKFCRWGGGGKRAWVQNSSRVFGPFLQICNFQRVNSNISFRNDCFFLNLDYYDYDIMKFFFILSRHSLC